jgi:hypothetical protein
MEPDVFKRLQGTARQEPVELPAELWTKIVYNVAAAYKRSGERRTQLLDAPPNLNALVRPLRHVRRRDHGHGHSQSEAERELEKQADIFVQERDYLISL